MPRLFNAFSPDGETLASGGWDDNVKIWGLSDGSIRYWWPAHKNRVTSVAFSLDGKMLASGSIDKSVKVWRIPETILINAW